MECCAITVWSQLSFLNLLVLFDRCLCRSFTSKLRCRVSEIVNLNDTQYSSSDVMSSASAPALSSARSRKGRAIACSVLLLDDTVDIFNVPVSGVIVCSLLAAVYCMYVMDQPTSVHVYGISVCWQWWTRRPRPHARFHHSWYRNISAHCPKIVKIWNFWYKFAPKTQLRVSDK